MEHMTVWGLITEASLLVKGVMLILLAASLLSWFLIVRRSAVLRRSERDIETFTQRLRSQGERLVHRLDVSEQSLEHPVVGEEIDVLLRLVLFMAALHLVSAAIGEEGAEILPPLGVLVGALSVLEEHVVEMLMRTRTHTRSPWSRRSLRW